jgi:hypothetical protein
LQKNKKGFFKRIKEKIKPPVNKDMTGMNISSTGQISHKLSFFINKNKSENISKTGPG